MPETPRAKVPIGLRVSVAERELVAAAAAALGWTQTDVLLSGAVACGADIATRWDGPMPEAAQRALRAYEAVQRERMRQPADTSARPTLAHLVHAVETDNADRLAADRQGRDS